MKKNLGENAVLPFCLALFMCSIFYTTAFAAGLGDISCEQAFAIYNRRNAWIAPDAIYQRMVSNGITKPLSEMTNDDAIAFRDKILSCNPEKQGMTFMRPQDFEVDLIWQGIQRAQSVESVYKQNNAAAKRLEEQLLLLENQFQEGSLAYAELAHGFGEAALEVHALSRNSVAFHNKDNGALSLRAKAGRSKVLERWGNGLEQKVSQTITVFNAMLAESRYNAAELYIQMDEAIRGLTPSIDEYLISYRSAFGSSAAIEAKKLLLKPLLTPLPELKKRLQTQVLAEIQAAFASIQERVKSASSPNDIANLKSLRPDDRDPGYEMKTQYSALLSNPQTKQALQLVGMNSGASSQSNIDGEVWSMCQGLKSDIGKAIANICGRAAQAACAEQTRDLDPEYKNHYLVLPVGGDGLRLQHLVCTAQGKGLYKKFKSGGLFSSAITLELESGTLYFRATRVDLDTLQEVGTSFKGQNVVNMLLATEFKPVSGKKQPIAKPGQEMSLLFIQLGGFPKPAECQ